MTGRLAAIWRHPIKSHGREALTEVTLTAGATLPGDRVWAVAHEASSVDGTAWAPSVNFTRAVKAGALTAIGSQGDGSGPLTLTHPDLPPLTFDPAREAERLIDWTAPLMTEGRARSTRLVRVPGRGMTDTDYPSVSLISAASNLALGEALGQPLDPGRWRANLLIEGAEPWAEFDWIGRALQIGEARLEVRERIKRCNATKASSVTGRTDADTLGALRQGWGHQDFGLYLAVTQGGRIAVGDALTLAD